ncbi:hypothetical protein B0H66DRAFT_605773 [Apodospora peruviana]|uniref:DUF1993 domain-containing protein n=1 Tax=Apodospora peruviana TaxID=516989 RepID=A0AAE0HZL9_9PEZI|nr:hypothetical protein B0H66DRAFT_605773 [Apodospora peruviana]
MAPPITAFDVSIDLNLRGLRALNTILVKASAHPVATTTNLSSAKQPGGQNMPSLAFHVQACTSLATDGLKLLTSAEQKAAAATSSEDTSLAHLIARVGNAISLLEAGATKPDALDGVEHRSLEVRYGNGQTATWGGRGYILGYNIPNFMFHLCMAYSTLQSQGVDVGKMDYLLPFMDGLAPAS